MPITKIKPTNISNTGVYGISTGTDITQNNSITAAFDAANNALSSSGSITANVQFNSFGVGTAASNTTGEIRATNNITAYYSSDIRLKKNIVPIENALASMDKLRGVRFEWTDDYIEQHGGEDEYFNRRHDVGVIAQELREVLPELVAERGDGYLAVKYDRIVALLIQSVKELKEEINELKKKQNG
jgi:hypothetical protein